ncbi:PH domain-containing protein [Streptomyces sp. NBC_00986]|uniref:PH domain-containing protein n=1 Tax=Streptomyces sp. NBC_00986 TaxID=2903702 RepID=UPI003870564F|nr:PH domain-containing protein [Streptomyces sp. NBC_00986]
MGGDDEDDRDDERGIEREYSRRRKMSRGRFVALCIVEGNFVLQMTRPDNTIPARYKLLAVALMALLSVWAILTARRGGTTVGADGVSTRGAFRVRRWAWHDIYDLRVETNPGQRRADIKSFTYLYENDGRRARLPYLDDWQLPDLWAEVADLHTASARHRGMTWERRPAVEVRIRERAAYRKAQQRATTGALIVFLAAFPYLLWEMSADGDPHPFLNLLLFCAPLAVYALLAFLFRRRYIRALAPA